MEPQFFPAPAQVCGTQAGWRISAPTEPDKTWKELVLVRWEPPTTNTDPSGNRVMRCFSRGCNIGEASVQVLATGS